ncbi:MAG: hypothetical protein NVSMB64_01210 [Candidatus Velthaea sp.]
MVGAISHSRVRRKRRFAKFAGREALHNGIDFLTKNTKFALYAFEFVTGRAFDAAAVYVRQRRT